jgi:hypothetical protein
MKNIIKKILKESEWDWTNEADKDVPVNEISNWVEETRYKISPLIQKIDEFYKQAPQVKWDKDEEVGNDQLVALSVKSIGDELKNIYYSLETISDEINHLSNPELFDDYDD